MAVNGRRRRRRGPSRVLLALIVLAVIAVAAYFIISSRAPKVGVITGGSIGTVYKAEGVIVRDEKTTSAEGLTTVTFYANEGERVPTGGRIADVYATGYSQSDVSKLLNIRKDIKERLKSELMTLHNDPQLDRLDSTIQGFAADLKLFIDGKADGNLVNVERQLSTTMARRHTYLKDKLYGNTTQSLREAYETESTLVKRIQSRSDTYLAKQECVVSFYTDGYESVLTTENFENITAAQVSSVLAGEEPQLTTAQRGRTSVFREVAPNEWYILLLSHDQTWNPVEGETYSLTLSGVQNAVVGAVVTSKARTGNELLVRMRVQGNVQPVLNVRTVSVEVTDPGSSGLQVPNAALYFQGEQWGVVMADGANYFVPVNVVLRTQTSAVIEPLVEGVLYEGLRVRLF